MKKTKIQWQLIHPRYWLIWLIFGLLWLITRLPYRLQLKTGRFFGFCLYQLPTKLKHITRTNIQLCFPELSQQEQTALIKKNFQSLGVGLIEAACAWWLPDEKLKNLFKITGYEYVEQAYAKGKGVILVAPHFTCLEMIPRILGMHYSFAVMFRPHKKPLISFIQNQFRNKHANVKYVPRDRIRELYRILENNLAIWYAYDVDGGEKRSVFAPFFNISTASLTSISRIAEKSNAAVVPIWFYRRENEMFYDVKLLPALDNFPGSDLVEDATRLNAILEKAIREKPEQYVWQYKRFKTRPPGEKRVY